MVLLHCPTPISTPIPVPIPMKMDTLIMCRTVSTGPTLFAILIPIPILNGYYIQFGTHIGTNKVEFN